MMKVISGGVDYVDGYKSGVRFGLQEILGIVVDIDRAAKDAIENGLATLDDAKRDFAKIETPIVWIRGQFDAWMDRKRVESVLEIGSQVGSRRVVEVPTGHQLLSSREALETFQLIAAEVSGMVGVEALPPALPDLGDLEDRRVAERGRLPRADVRLREFWRDYLLGRNRHLGIELMHGTSRYRELMSRQIDMLGISSGDRVADLGSGTGAFPIALLAEQRALPDLIHEIDFVSEGLERARVRLRELGVAGSPTIQFDVVDFDTQDGGDLLRFGAGSYDKALASLLLGYLKHPRQFLRTIRELLKPGGLIVLSNLRPDADISRIYQEGLSELCDGLVDGVDGSDPAVLEAARSFLNDAARLVELEEDGRFHFFEEGELAELVADSGFAVESVERSFGDPPQAILLTARRV